MKANYIKAVKDFDYLRAGETYKTWPIDRTHTRFWNVERDCGTFISNWQVEQGIKNNSLEIVTC